MDENHDDAGPTVVAPDNIAPSTVIDFVQQQRINMLTGRELDTKESITVLRDLSRTAIDQSKNEVSRENNKEIAAAFAAVAASRAENPFLGKRPDGPPIADIPDVEPLPGELSNDPSDLDYKNTYAAGRSESKSE